MDDIITLIAIIISAFLFLSFLYFFIAYLPEINTFVTKVFYKLGNYSTEIIWGILFSSSIFLIIIFPPAPFLVAYCFLTDNLRKKHILKSVYLSILLAIGAPFITTFFIALIIGGIVGVFNFFIPDTKTNSLVNSSFNQNQNVRCNITTCCDGTCSNSTGRGTCSHHGGVC